MKPAAGGRAPICDNTKAVSLWIYNRRLAWVVIPAVVWAAIGLFLALGAGRPGVEGEQPLGLRLGLAEGGLRLPGQVLEVIEGDDGLHITLAVRADARPDLPELPAGVSVEFVTPTGPPTGPPLIELAPSGHVIKLPGGRVLALTDDYVLKFGREDLRIVPRPPQLTGERLKRWLHEQGDKGHEAPRPERPGPGRRGDPNV